MNYSLIDSAGLVLAIAASGLLVVLPGAALAGLFGVMGFAGADQETKPLVAIVTGLALLPGLDSLVMRFIGLDSALALNLGLVCLALASLVRDRRTSRKTGQETGEIRVSRVALILILVWFLILTFEWIDFDIGGRLYQPFVVIDLVKHAATTQAIFDTGGPPRDPFFYRPERVSYYYFFYTLAALSQRLCFGLIDARAAVGGLAFWTGLGLYGMARLVMARAGFMTLESSSGAIDGPVVPAIAALAEAQTPAPRHAPAILRSIDAVAWHRCRFLLLMLMASSGLEILFILHVGILWNLWLPDTLSWSDAVANWFAAVIWVPHHLTGLIASLMGFVAVADAIDLPPRRAAMAVVLAALCFASAVGLSVWLSLGAVATAALWFAVLIAERRWRAAGILATAGLVAVLLAAPALLDLRNGRTGPLPIEFVVRAFTPVDVMVQDEPFRSIARLVALPINYLMEFGALFFGALLFWRTNRAAVVHRNEVARVLTLSAIAGLILGTFLRSTLFHNNDLGWRVLMFPQFAALCWSCTALHQRWAAAPLQPPARAWRLLSPPLLGVLLVGYGTTFYSFVSLRAHPAMPTAARPFATDAVTVRAQRAAYAWANDHLALSQVLQHSPIPGKRAVAFGLYSRNPVGVSDICGSLYGEQVAAVHRRLHDVIPIFTDDLSDREVRDRAKANGIDELVVTANDAVWTSPTSWVWRAKPDYASPQVRIIPIAGLGLSETAARLSAGAHAGLF